MKSAVAYDLPVPRLIRLIGGRWRNDSNSYQMRWGELSFRRFGFAAALCMFEEGFSLNLHFLWPQVFVNLPFLKRWHRDPHEVMESWGFSYHSDIGQLHLNWGNRHKIIDMPWRDWVQVSHDVLKPDGTWTPFVGSWEEGPPRVVNDKGATFGGKEPDGRLIESHEYRYLLKSGEVQHRVAKCSAERRISRLKWLRWTSLFQRTNHAIDVSFSDEVGERTGSWKGGCVGCGYEMKPDETIRECLKRMESERRF